MQTLLTQCYSCDSLILSAFFFYPCRIVSDLHSSLFLFIKMLSVLVIPAGLKTRMGCNGGQWSCDLSETLRDGGVSVRCITFSKVCVVFFWCCFGLFFVNKKIQAGIEGGKRIFLLARQWIRGLHVNSINNKHLLSAFVDQRNHRPALFFLCPFTNLRVMKSQVRVHLDNI